MKSPWDWFRSGKKRPGADTSTRSASAAQGSAEQIDESKSPAQRPLQGSPAIRRRTVRLTVGLDFGTSSSKIAYSVLGEPGRPVRPLSFGHSLACYPHYSYPSVGRIHEGGITWGPKAAATLESDSWDRGIRRLKVLLAGRYDEQFRDDELDLRHNEYLESRGFDPSKYTPDALTAAALAEQLGGIRTMLGEIHDHRVDDISFNVCVPVDHVENSTVLSAYHRVVNAAQRSLNDDGQPKRHGRELVDLMADTVDHAPAVEQADGRVFTVPECVAQVVCYVNSLGADRGVHGVIDIGAGTTDIAIFNMKISPDEPPRLFWYAARNLPIGAASIEAAVAIESFEKGRGASVTQAELVQAIRDAPRGSEVYELATNLVDREVWQRSRGVWVEAYNHLRRQSLWEDRPVFLAGGGAALPGVADIFARPWVPNFQGHKTQQLPVPTDYRPSDGDDIPFSRMSVAYGLTFAKPELPEFILPNDSPDQTPPPTILPFEPAWRDQATPTPGWV